MSGVDTGEQERCIFCKIIRGDIPNHTVYEDKDVLAFFDINPMAEDHFLVIPKQHHKCFSETPDEVLAKLVATGKRIITTMGHPEYNVINNCGPIAGQSVHHIHFHFIPAPNPISEGIMALEGKDGAQRPPVDHAALGARAAEIRSSLSHKSE